MLYKLLQDFSIFFPFITEELYQNIFGQEKSIHLTRLEELNYDFGDVDYYGDLIVDIISNARGVKTEKNVSLKTPITLLKLNVNEKLYDVLDLAFMDFQATLSLEKLEKNRQEIETFEIVNISL